MTRDWKLGAQVLSPESPSKIEILRVTHDPGFTTVIGQVTWSEDSATHGDLLEVRVEFDGLQVGVRSSIGDASWDAGHPRAREFTVTTDPVPTTASSMDVRIGESAVAVSLE